jgi:hypothetical protein
MEITIEIEKLIEAPYNPPNRCEGQLKGLVDSINRVGILYPILINEKNQIIDGHRRVSAAKKIGMKYIRAFVVNGDRSELFCEVNSETRKMTSKDALFVYISGGNLIPSVSQSIKHLEDIVGYDGLVAIHAAGYAPKNLKIVLHFVQLYVGDKSNEFAKKIIHWIINNKGMSNMVRVAMTYEIPSDELKRHIVENIPLSTKFGNNETLG